MEENEKNISYTEEPIVSYYSSSLNLGVCAIFSNRNSKSYKHSHFSFTPTNSNNNKFSLCNTIMLPSITNDISNPEENNKKNKNNRFAESKDTLFSLKKENVILKLDISKEEKCDINDDKNINNDILGKKENNNGELYENSNFKERKSPLEINPFFLGKTLSFNINNNKNNNIKPIKSAVNIDQLKGEDNKEKNEELKGFLNREKSKSVFCADERIDKKNSIKIKQEDDDKSEKVRKKNNKINTKNSFLNTKTEDKKDKEKSIKQRGFKRKITFNMETKFTKRDKEKNKTLDKDQNKRKEKSKDKEKEDSIKKKKEKDKSKNKELSRTNFKYNITIDKRRQSYYFSNKCITNTFNINFFNTIKKNRLDNSSVDEKNLGKKSTKRKNKLSKTKEEIKKNKPSNKYKTYSQSKGIASLKEYIKAKESDEIKDDNYDVRSKSSKSVEHKNVEIKNKRYNSKKEIKRINIKRKDSDSEKKEKKKQKLKRGRTFVIEEEEDDEDNQNKNNTEKKMNDKKEEKDKEEKCKEEKTKKKSSTKQLLIREKESYKEKDNNSDDKSKINKCLTADLRRKKNSSIFDKNLRGGKLSNSSKNKKGVGSMVMNLFGKNYQNKNKNKNDIDFEFALKNNLKKMQFNLFSKDKFTNTEFSDSDYLKYTLDCMELILDIDMEKQTRLKNKINFNFPKPKKNKIKKKIALFDLDETLVHCTGDIKNHKEKYQHKIEIKLPGKQAVEVGINLRPYWKETMNLIKKKYHIVVYTASHQAYADSVLDFMDPKKKYFKYRLYRNNCSLTDVDGSKFYIKDLDIFNEYYDLKDIVIIDNSVLSFAYHLHNGVPIVPYYDEDKDGSLYVVGLYLLHIFDEEDLREANKKQINLDSFLEEAKKNKEEEEEDYIDDNQIEEASDSKEDDNNENENENENNNDKKEENIENIENKENKENNDNIEEENNKKGELSQKVSKKSVDLPKKASDKEQKKYSEKKLHSGMKKKSSNFLCYIDHHNRDDQNDITQKKLMSQSKLINMYYEVKDKSPSSEYRVEIPKSKLNCENQSNLKDNNAILKDKNNDNGATIIFVDNDEIDCKSDPGFFPNEQNNLSDNESSVEEKAKKEPVLTRMLTIFENTSFDNRKDSQSIKDNNKVKLGFIRSNFYNNFKI